MRQLYLLFNNEKVAPLVRQLSWSNCLVLLPIKNIDKINYYIGEARAKYGNNLIKEYSMKLTNELGKKYSISMLKYMRKFYLFQKSQTVSDQLTWSHYLEIMSLESKDEIAYYIENAKKNKLSIRELREKIKSKEYERLPNATKLKLKSQENIEIQDFVKNPIIIKNKLNIESISEKTLKTLILEDIPSFLKQLGDGFAFIDSEYKIKLGDSYNSIDLLLFNYKYNAFVVVELKVTELKKEHIGQIQVYMNYIDKNIKTINNNKTIGLIIVKKGNKYIIEYSSNPNIFETSYILKN